MFAVKVVFKRAGTRGSKTNWLSHHNTQPVKQKQKNTTATLSIMFNLIASTHFAPEQMDAKTASLTELILSWHIAMGPSYEQSAPSCVPHDVNEHTLHSC